MDEEVFRGMDLPKKEESSPMVPVIADITPVMDIHGAINVPEAQPIPSPMLVKKTQSMPGGKKYYTHPSRY